MNKLLLILIITWQAKSWAGPGDVCEDSQLYLGCNADNILQKNAQGYQCLQKYLACGKYEDITASLGELDGGPDSFQRYYLGAAYFALQVETTSAAVKCSHVTKSRKSLEQFLLDALEEFDSKGTFVSFPIQHIRHANKLMTDLDKQGCLDGNIDLTRAKQLAERYGHEQIKDLFFQDKPVCAEAGSDAIGRMTAIGCNMQDFVTKASGIEGGIALRIVELDTLESYLLGPIITPATSNTPAIRGGGIDVESQFIIEKKPTESKTRTEKIRDYAVSLYKKALQVKALFLAQMEHLGIANPNNLEGQIQANNENFTSLLELGEGQRNFQTEIYQNTDLTNLNQDTNFRDPTQDKVEDLMNFWRNSAQNDGYHQRCIDDYQAFWYCQSAEQGAVP